MWDDKLLIHLCIQVDEKASHPLQEKGLAVVQLDLQGTDNDIWTIIGKYSNVIRYATGCGQSGRCTSNKK